jgi:hypothetical protein
MGPFSHLELFLHARHLEPRGPLQRRAALGIGRRHVGPAVQQQPGHVEAVVVHGGMQRRAPLPVHLVDVRPVRQQHLHHLDVPTTHIQSENSAQCLDVPTTRNRSENSTQWGGIWLRRLIRYRPNSHLKRLSPKG